MHLYAYPTVRELPRRPIDIAETLTLPDWRDRAEQIASMDAQRRAIVALPEARS